MCYSKYTTEQVLEKEAAIRVNTGYVNEYSNIVEFMSLYFKQIRYEFLSHLHDSKGYAPTKIIHPTVEFLKHLEILTYEFCRLSLIDVYCRRYLKSYLAASFLVMSFQLLIDLA